MKRGWKHVSSGAHEYRPEIGPHLIPQYEYEREDLCCVHCREPMYEYDGTEFWNPLPFRRFAEPHQRDVTVFKNYGILEEELELSGRIDWHKSALLLCHVCGWWIAVESAVLPAVKWQSWQVTLVAPAVLKSLDLTDISIPVKEVRRYLTRRFEERRLLHPRKFEEVVASVFKDYGYETLVTAYSHDGGIDVVLNGGKGDTVGVQVKRCQRRICAGQIREFLGALVVEGHARGIFVSASDYQKGASALADKCNREHLSIDLVGPERFLSMLNIAQHVDGVEPEECGLSKACPPSFVSHGHSCCKPI